MDPGDISVSAWQVTGEDLMSLNGADVRDPSRRQPMCIISFCQYNSELQEEQQKKMKERRVAQSAQASSASSGNPWKSSYV